MQGGDISNFLAPTIAIDIDGLIIFTKSRLFGVLQSQELNTAAIRVCEHHITNGRMIYLLAHGRSSEEVERLEQILDTYDFPYTKLFPVLSNTDRENILSRKHVHLYFYMDSLHSATDNKRKERQILNITESYF